MNEKVKLPENVVVAIESLKVKGFSLAEIGIKKATSQLPEVNGWYELMQIDNDTLFRALYCGYEVEMTPEDKVRELYMEYKSCEDNEGPSGYESAIALEVIIKVLGFLNIRISGVNMK